MVDIRNRNGINLTDKTFKFEMENNFWKNYKKALKLSLKSTFACIKTHNTIHIKIILDHETASRLVRSQIKCHHIKINSLKGPERAMINKN